MRFKPLAICALAGAVLAGGCAPYQATGYNIGVGNPSDGFRVTFSDQSQGYAYWCTEMGTCIARARAACANSFTLRDIGEIDRALSPDASARGFFDKARTQLATLVVSC